MAITALQQKNSNSLVLLYANRYFLTNRNRIDPSRLSYIMAIYELVAGGLNSDVTLKIGSNIGKRDKDPLGAVRTRYTKLDLTKPYHTKVWDREERSWGRTGAIRIDHSEILNRDQLDPTSGIVTLIHEASHKYAGTMDYSYFRNGGETPEKRFDNDEKAQMNADSYAWFAQRVWGRRGEIGM